MPITTSENHIVNAPRLNAWDRELEPYREMVERYRGELVNQALAILGRMEDAEDVTQETFCEAIRNPEALARAEALGPWLRAINRSNALDRLRQRRRESCRLGPVPSRTATTGGFSLLVLREAVAKSVESLPDELREVVVLRYWNELEYEEIARRLKVSAITVRRRLRDALSSLFRQGHLKPFIGATSVPPPCEPAPHEHPGEPRT